MDKRNLSQPDGPVDRAARVLARAEKLVVTTGAGMSKESGIPTFRDAPSALWANYNPEDLASPEGFRRNPELVWKWYVERREMIAACEPHAGHFALARLGKLYREYLLLTQNIDNLHRRAGSDDVVEVHGNIFKFKCFDRDHPARSLPEGDEIPPRCQCGSYLRPDVVWYGELLDRHLLERAYGALAMCDAILVVGTSGIVYPAAGFPALARQVGATVIEVNPQETPITEIADIFVPMGAKEALPTLVDTIAGYKNVAPPG